jgi:hypothetical protein
MFAPNSRYHGLATYTITAPDGSTIVCTRLPQPNPLTLAGYHRRILGDRLDLLAARYAKDPTFFWRLCNSNTSFAPDALAARDLIGIPKGPST